MTKEERIKELAEEHKRKDNEISESIGLGFDGFKDADWHAVRMECREDVALKAMAFMVSELAGYIANKLTSEGRYDLLFCLKKHSGIENSDEVAKQMEGIEAQREALRANFKAEVMKIEAEYGNVCTKEFEEDMKEVLEIAEEENAKGAH